MDIYFQKQRIKLTDADLLGEGGEAKVYAHGALALKLFHPIDPALPKSDRARLERVLQQKLDKLRAFPRGLPDAVIAPVGLVHDRAGAPIGYAMPRLSGAQDALRLAQRTFREGVIGNDAVTRIYTALRAVLERLHALDVVVGDLNDGNVQFANEKPFLIDADSMQFGGFPCAVGHERFLDPLLYGVDLAARPSFVPGNDWYAFSVQLFHALLYVHPFGGVHPKLPTLLRRAEARHSVLRPDVRYPRTAVHFRVLPDELLTRFEAIFEKDDRAPIPDPLLQLSWTKCRCGLEHAREHCPDCRSRNPLAPRPVVVHHGRCRAETILETRGRVLAATMQGELRYLYEEDGILKREDQAEVARTPMHPGMRFALSGHTTWIADGRSALAIRGGKTLARVNVSSAGPTGAHEPAFDAGSLGAVFAQGDWLVDESGARLGKVLAERTWLRVGQKLGFGFYRAGACAFGFIFEPGRGGLRELQLPGLRGHVIDAACTFDERLVLFSVATEADGVRTHHAFLIDSSGVLIASHSGSPDTDRVVQSIHGKALLDGRILTLTDDGLLAITVDAASKRLREGTLFPDTQPFVDANAQLLAAPGGAAVVVTPRSITRLSLSQSP